ncbi:MAG TPA: hypothetical protein VGG69_07200 [Rhizomicrobium sp.]
MYYRTFCCASAALLCCGTAHANPIKEIAGPVQQVQVVSDHDAVTTTVQCTDHYDNIPGAALSITIPAGASQLLVARFNGRVSALQSSGGNAGASVRMVVGTRELNPAGGLNVAAESSISFIQPPAQFERSGPISPGTHTVRAQFCVSGDNTSSATVRDWHFSIEAAAAADH